LQKRHHLMVWPALVTLLLDQVSKLAVARGLRIYDSVPLVDGFFNLVHVRNRGMAFGLMNRPDADFVFYALVIASIGAIAILLIWLFRFEQERGRITFGLSLILGGAVGNLVDRIRFREVIDFMDFYLGSYHWPAFNVADSAITIGTLWVAINLFFKDRSHI